MVWHAKTSFNPLSKHPHDPKLKFLGVYAGRVEYINDPAQLGRIKVRVPQAYGLLEDIATKDLPWARPCFPFGGGHDYGSIAVPPVGSSAWVFFIEGDTSDPVWIGAWPAMPTKPRPMLRADGLPAGEVSMSETPEEPWTPPPGPEPPKEYLQQVNNRPETYIPFKSPKGASLVIVDRDEAEKVSLVDRLGQGLTIQGNVSKEANKNNQFSRKLNTANDGVGLPIETTVTQDGYVSLVDLGGQSIELTTKKEITDSENARWSNKIKITSRQPFSKDGESPSGQKETEGQRFVNLELSGAEGKFTLELSGDSSPEHPVARTTIHIDGSTGSIEISSPLSLKINSKNIALEGNILLDGNVTVSKDVIIGSNLLVGGDSISVGNSNTEIVAPALPEL